MARILIAALALSLVAAQSATWSVTVSRYIASPTVVTINVGDTVTWTANDPYSDVVSDDGLFQSPLPFGQYSYTFFTPGDYAWKGTRFPLNGGLVIVSSVPVNAPPDVQITSHTWGDIVPSRQVTLTASAVDAEGSVTRVQFFDAYRLIGTDTDFPYELQTTLGEGAHYITARATDNNGAVSASEGVFLEVQPRNQPPSVVIDSPLDNATFTFGNVVTLSASASDIDGTIASMEFFMDGSSVGRTTQSSFGIMLLPDPGFHTFFVRATDNSGAVTDSSPVRISVQSANRPPQVSIIKGDGTYYAIESVAISLEAAASDPDGTVREVQFYQNGLLLGSDFQSPYQVTFEAAIGNYSVTAKAFDNAGAFTISEPVQIYVDIPQDQFPNVTFLSPVAGAYVVERSEFVVKIEATGPPGEPLRVELYMDELLVGTAPAPPFEFKLPAPTRGIHTLRAQATAGNMPNSNSQSFRVVARPQIQSISPHPIDEIAISFKADTGPVFSLERSIDLKNWTFASSQFFEMNGLFVLTDAAPQAGESRFYRIHME